QPADQEGPARRPRIPELRQLPTPSVARVRQRQMADSTHRKNQRTRSPLGRVEPNYRSPAVIERQKGAGGQSVQTGVRFPLPSGNGTPEGWGRAVGSNWRSFTAPQR